MSKSPAWNEEFSLVVACKHCSVSVDRNLLRDEEENVPQPGWVGLNYKRGGLLLVGQKLGTRKSLATEDLPYTKALRNLRDDNSDLMYRELVRVMRTFIPQWPVHGNYFRLAECGLALDDIAYCNIVRCRTEADRSPGATLLSNCVAQHFTHWLNLLAPSAIVFIGKWSADRGAQAVAKGIPCKFMNRQRSLSSELRAENRNDVVKFVRSVVL